MCVSMFAFMNVLRASKYGLSIEECMLYAQRLLFLGATINVTVILPVFSACPPCLC